MIPVVFLAGIFNLIPKNPEPYLSMDLNPVPAICKKMLRLSIKYKINCKQSYIHSFFVFVLKRYVNFLHGGHEITHTHTHMYSKTVRKMNLNVRLSKAQFHRFG